MTRYAWILLLAGLSPARPLQAQATAPKPAAQVPGPQSDEAQDLSSQATDPTPSLMALNLVSDFKVSYQWNLKNIEGAEKGKIVFTPTLLVPSR